MEQSKARRKTAYAKLLVVALAASFFAMHSCKDDDFSSANKDHNVTLAFTRAGDTSAEQIPTMRLFTFYNDNAAPNDKMFHGEVLNLARNLSASQVSAQVETGTWNMVLLSTPNGGNIMSPVAGTVMSQLPMYKYQPTTSNGKSSNAHEIFLDNRVTPNITSGGSHNMTAQLNRTVAKVELIIEKTTPNFNLTGTHSIKLHNVPSTLSYTGALLPGKATPDTLSGALRAPVQLQNAGNGSYEGVETISFIIPAHRGADYINYTGTTPNDTTTLKMDVTVDLERVGGTRFAKQAEIPVVAKANMVLRVYITVNDGLEFRTEVLDWQGVPLDMTVGAGYQNWLYVKKGATGNGISWSDALPDISTAITKATALMNAGKTVNGVLVAGGSDASMLYSEGFDIPQNVKVYGGWAGTPGTELAGGDAAAPYKSTDRNLKNYKARLSLSGSNSVAVSGASALLDGFIISGAATSGNLITVSNTSAAINAVEITNNTTTSGSVLNMTAGVASNVLVADNTRGITVISGAKLINATVTNNTASSTITNSTVLNSAFWRSAATISGTNAIANCAFEGTHTSIPTGVTNVSLNNTNVIWFTTSNTVPGPHFNANVTSANYYEALNDRSPLIGRGSQSNFDDNTSYIPSGYKKDIDGNERHISNSTITTAVTDIGCYEAGDTFKGFILKWASDRIYVSYKATYKSEYPLMLPNNDTYQIGVNWTATTNNLNYTSLTNSGGTVVNSISESGTEVVVGRLNFLNNGNITPDDDWKGAERKCGEINITTNLGNYLPNTTLDVYQTSGTESKWTAGYVGSFHRNKEVGARYISGTNTGAWTARIISGLDWIKIDGKDKTYGTPITDSDEKTPPTGGDSYYREVEQVWNGVVSGTGNIQFRVGMQSKNTTGSPRYGLIIITRTAGVSMFFVRQGEDDDYLYRPGDAKPSGNPRTDIVRVSPYNLTDPNNNMSTTGSELGAGGATFVDYPTKVGYYFKWNQTRAHRPGTTTTVTGTTYASWSTSREICPSGYRHPSHMEFVNSVYYNITPTLPLTTATGSMAISPDATEGSDVLKNVMWGAYADGYFDQLASAPLSTSTSYQVGSGPDLGAKGTLMVNHYNYSAVFYPSGGGYMTSTGSFSQAGYAMYYTSTYYSNNKGSNTHWQGTHIGMNCTGIASTGAATTRCVKP